MSDPAPQPAPPVARIDPSAHRRGAKFTEKWDLCYAFIKHGSCKDKNCQWRRLASRLGGADHASCICPGRHELPPKKEEAKEVKETKVETKAKPVPPVKRERTNGSEREGERLYGRKEERFSKVRTEQV